MSASHRLTIVSLLFLLSPSMALAGIIHVGPTRPTTTISAGFAIATNGDTILIDDGIYNETLVVSKQVTFEAVNIGGAIVDGQRGGSGLSVFDVRTDSTFIGLHIRNTLAGINIRQGANAQVRVERVIASDFSGSAFSVGQPAGRVGRIDVFNSLVLDSSTAAGINDGDTITMTNTILDNVNTAYVIHNGNSIIAMNNLFHNVTNRRAFGPIPGSIPADLAEIIADPLFIDRAGGDFRLQAGSPAIDSGEDIGFPFLGSAPDRGPFEFSPQGNVVAEPSSLALCFVAAGVTGLYSIRRCRRKRKARRVKP